jgi:hypothetical protein
MDIAMKYTVFAFLFSVLLSFAPQKVLAQGFEKYSYPLAQVLDAIYDASFDFDGVYTITHNLWSVKSDGDHCEIVPAHTLVNHFARIFEEYRSFYPDEELPYDKALVDVQRITRNTDYERCVDIEVDGPYHNEITSYRALENKLWVKIEYSTNQF